MIDTLEVLITNARIFSKKGMSNTVLALIIMAILLVVGIIFITTQHDNTERTFGKIFCLFPGARCE